MDIINYTKVFALNFSGPNINQTIRNRSIFNPLGRVWDAATNNVRVRSTITKNNGKQVSANLSLRNGLLNSNKTVGSASLAKGGFMDRLRWNTGAGKSTASGLVNNNAKGKLSFGSKAKIAATGAISGALAGKLTGSIAKQKAQQSAINKGLKPGTPEYNEYVRSKEQIGKLSGRAIGGLAGGLGMRYLGKNTFKAVNKI